MVNVNYVLVCVCVWFLDKSFIIIIIYRLQRSVSNVVLVGCYLNRIPLSHLCQIRVCFKLLYLPVVPSTVLPDSIELCHNYDVSIYDK